MACRFRQELPGVLVRVEDGASFSPMTPRELYRWEMACHFRQELLLYTRTPHPHCNIALLAMSRLSRLVNIAKGVGGEESMGRRLHMESHRQH